MNGSSINIKLSYIFATGFGSGYVPFAPGTAGSLLALLMFWFTPANWMIAVILLFALIGWPAAAQIERIAGKDPSIVVIDEIVGQGIALLFVPRTVVFYLISFVLFRLFDIFKPYPAHQSQNIGGGTGIMIDDIIAAVYAQIAFWLIYYLLFK